MPQVRVVNGYRLDIDSQEDGRRWIGLVNIVDPRTDMVVHKIHTMAMHSNPDDAEVTVGTMATEYAWSLESAAE